jgi:glycosyltransferase involved in cell wall biosynthesis
LKIAILSETFTKNMGYIERSLPRELARLGADVHVVTTDLQAYHSDPNYAATYERFNGPAVQSCGTEQFEGFTLHRLPHRMLLGYARIGGLGRKLRELRPDVVQTFSAASWIPQAAAVSQIRLGFSLFTGAHQTASVMSPSLLRGRRFSVERLRSDARRAIPGRFVSLRSVKCFAATTDCADVAVRFYGVERHKIELCPLGVDVSLFRPLRDSADVALRQSIRLAHGANVEDTVFVYTGRFTDQKNPLCLAQATARLRHEGFSVRAWFYGSGPQADAIAREDGCVVRPFVPVHELPDVYSAADIGVWPTQESMSMLDAAACGLPIVISDRVQAVERFDGNGLRYREADVGDLALVLRELFDESARRRLGAAGAAKVSARFSWGAIAAGRLASYGAAVESRRNFR